MTAGMLGAGFVAFGSALPEKVLTNTDLEKMVDTNDEWIVARTGIHERRIASAEESSSVLGARAAAKAMARAGVAADEIDLLVVATSSPDMVFPSTACLIQNKLGLRRIAAFDVVAVCTGFIYATTVAAALMRTGGYMKALVVGCDSFSKFIDWEDRATCILFGDGAGAAVMAPCEAGEGVINSYLAADGSGWHQLYVPAGGSASPASADTVAGREHYVRMNGSEVFKFAVRAIPEACSKVLENSGRSLDEVSLIIPHQANRRIIEAARSRMNLGQERIPSNLHKYGNTSSASIPILLDELWEEGRMKRGSLFITVGFGAGLTWGANLISWTGPDSPPAGSQ